MLDDFNKLFVFNSWWQCPAMFCLYTSSKLSRPEFEFSLKVKVMGSNPGYLFYFRTKSDQVGRSFATPIKILPKFSKKVHISAPFFLDCCLLCLFSREKEFSKLTSTRWLLKWQLIKVINRKKYWFWSVPKTFGPSCFFRLYRK